MTPPLLKLAAAMLAAVSLNAVAAAAESSPPPKVFNDVGVTMQSRICGELMAGLALGGVQALKMQFPTGKVPEAQRKPVYDTGAQAVVLLSMAGSLKLEERLKAGEIASAIEKMEPQVHVDTAMFCQRRVEAWIRAGEVKKDFITQAYAQAQQLMDKAFASNGPGDEDQ
ncbi:hypothetical protein [Burkholderia ubonensis]|uniref:hypothetical protein n=1 Tax=Burkholderia ubonensis TaxID=101571 RepID=UPI000753EE9A|nr:hypothetical protein [Burkholderia ubonensis]KVP17396.1 hypothetical protein WJ84_03965 [Burkholderia ubonensis]